MVEVNDEKLEGLVKKIKDNYNGILHFKNIRMLWHNLQLFRRQREVEYHAQRNLSAIERYHASNGSVMEGLKALGNRWFKDHTDIPPGYFGTVSYIEKHHPDIDQPNYRINLTDNPLVKSHVENSGLDGKVIINGIPEKNHPYGKKMHFACGPFVFCYLDGEELAEDFGDSITDSGLLHELGHVKSSYHLDKEEFYEEVYAQLFSGNNVKDIMTWIDLVNPRFQNKDLTKDLAKALALEKRYRALKASQSIDTVDNRLLMCENLNEALFELYVVNNYEKSQN